VGRHGQTDNVHYVMQSDTGRVECIIKFLHDMAYNFVVVIEQEHSVVTLAPPLTQPPLNCYYSYYTKVRVAATCLVVQNYQNRQNRKL